MNNKTKKFNDVNMTTQVLRENREIFTEIFFTSIYRAWQALNKTERKECLVDMFQLVTVYRRLQQHFEPLGVGAFTACCRWRCTKTYADAEGFGRKKGIYFFNFHIYSCLPPARPRGWRLKSKPIYVKVSYTDFDYLLDNWETELKLIHAWCSIIAPEMKYEVRKPENKYRFVTVVLISGLQARLDAQKKEEEGMVNFIDQQMSYEGGNTRWKRWGFDVGITEVPFFTNRRTHWLDAIKRAWEEEFHHTPHPYEPSDEYKERLPFSSAYYQHYGGWNIFSDYVWARLTSEEQSRARQAAIRAYGEIPSHVIAIYGNRRNEPSHWRRKKRVIGPLDLPKDLERILKLFQERIFLLACAISRRQGNAPRSEYEWPPVYYQYTHGLDYDPVRTHCKFWGKKSWIGSNKCPFWGWAAHADDYLIDFICDVRRTPRIEYNRTRAFPLWLQNELDGREPADWYKKQSHKYKVYFENFQAVTNAGEEINGLDAVRQYFSRDLGRGLRVDAIEVKNIRIWGLQEMRHVWN